MELIRSQKRRLQRRGLVAAAVVVTAIAVSHASATAEPTPTRICSVSPAANSMPLGTELATTVRDGGTDVEVLHEVVCDGRTVGWRWLSTAQVLAL